MDEVWKPIPGHPNYEVSDHGRARRVAGGQGTRAGLILKPKPHPYGYCMYSLSQNNKVRDQTAHRLVALAFIGPPPFPKAQATHEDGNPKNNTRGNIVWKTPTGNARDKWRHGTQRYGERHQNSKLTEAGVLEMKRLRAEGWSWQRLGTRFGVSMSNARAAVLGTQWSHLKEDARKAAEACGDFEAAPVAPSPATPQETRTA